MNYLSKKTQKLVAKGLVVTSIMGLGVGINININKPVIAMASESTSANTTVGNLIYSVSENNATVVGNTGISGDIVIPSTVSIDGITYNVTSIEDNAFYGCKDLTSVIIPNSVTSIGDQAFASSINLKSVTIPNSVTSIGTQAFSSCTGLTSVTIPNSVTSIGSQVFDKCAGLTSVTIPDSVKSIGYAAFANCIGLTSVVIPDSVTSIGYGAFKNCTGLTSVTLPDSVTSIGYKIFDGCTNLTIPDSYKDSAFQTVGNLIYSVSGSNATVIGTTATSGEVIIPATVDIDGVSYNITAIGSEAFKGCTGLTNVIIPNSVTDIGINSFNACSGLTDIEIPNSVTSIETGAFAYCTKLTSVTIPNSVTFLEESVFYGCTGLTSITIPNSVTSLNSCEFKGCTSLTSVTIPNSVTSIKPGAFADCTSLTSVIIPDSVTSIGDQSFQNCTKLTSVKLNNVSQLDLFVDSNTNYHKVNFTDKSGNDLGSYAVLDGTDMSTLVTNPTLSYGNFTGWKTDSSQLNNITSDTTFTALSDTDDSSITIPSGYDEHDYKALYNFLAQKDENGVTNATKMGADLSDLTKNINGTGTTSLGAATTNNIAWRFDSTTNKYHLTRFMGVGLGLVGNADFSNCNSLIELDLDRSDYIGSDISTAVENNFTSLNVTGCTALTQLTFDGYNDVSSIDLSTNVNLNQLNICTSNVSQLNVGNCTKLVYLHVQESKLSNLDISKFKSLQNLVISDNINLTGLTGGFNFSTFKIGSYSAYIGNDSYERSSYKLDLSTYNFADNQLYLNDIYLNELDMGNFSVKSDSNKFIYWVKWSGDSTAFEAKSDSSYAVPTLEAQDLSSTQTGKWVLTSRTDGSTKTLYGKSIPASNIEGYDVDLSTVDVANLNLNDITVEQGTDVADLNLPNTVDMTLGDSTTSAAVTWNTSNYDGDTAGTYTLTGNLNIDGVDTSNLTASVNINVTSKNEDTTTGPAVTTTPSAVTIEGTPKVGDTLTAQLLDKNRNETTTSAAVTYEWYRLDNQDSNFDNVIATGKKYVTEVEDLGKYIGVKVSCLGHNFTDIVGKVLDNNSNSGNPDTNPNGNDIDTNLNAAYNLIKAELDSVTYNNSTTKDNIISNLNSLTLPNGVTASVTGFNLNEANYSNAGTVKVNVTISENGKSKTLDYVGNISKLTSSSTSHSSGGSSGGSSSSSSGSSSSSDSSSNQTTTTTNNDNDVKTTSNSANTQVAATSVVTLTASHDATQIKASEGMKVVTTPLGGVVQVPTDKKAWVVDNGTWFLFDKGNKATSWNQVNSKWYYLNNNTGAMQTGWVNDNANWYYLNSNGAMATGWINNDESWYYLDSNGAMKTGWLQNSDGNWYYLNSDGSMAANTTIDGYTLDETGKWVQ